MRTDWQCNHCSCKALPVSHPLRFPFHPFCPRPLPLFLSTTTSVDQEATKGTMSHQTLMATSSYSIVHITILSMLFSFLGGKLSVPGTHQCWQHNVDNSCSFGFVFQFQRKTAWLNYEFRALCSLLKSRKVIQRKVKKFKLIPHLHFPFYQMSNPGPIIVLPCYLQYPANKLSSLRARCKLISAAPDLWTFLCLLQLLVFEEQPNLCEGCTSCSVWAKVHL